MEPKELIELQQEIEVAASEYVTELIENGEDSTETSDQDFQNGALWMLTRLLEGKK